MSALNEFLPPDLPDLVAAVKAVVTDDNMEAAADAVYFFCEDGGAKLKSAEDADDMDLVEKHQLGNDDIDVCALANLKESGGAKALRTAVCLQYLASETEIFLQTAEVREALLRAVHEVIWKQVEPGEYKSGVWGRNVGGGGSRWEGGGASEHM